MKPQKLLNLLTSWMNQERVPYGNFIWKELAVSRNLVPNEEIVWILCVDIKCLQANIYLRGLVCIFEDRGFILNWEINCHTSGLGCQLILGFRNKGSSQPELQISKLGAWNTLKIPKWVPLSQFLNLWNERFGLHGTIMFLLCQEF